MDNVNYQFYEEFTKLDRLCSEIYQLDNGVGTYLAEMTAVSAAWAEKVPGWIPDMEQLYRYYVLRKAMAQSGEAFRDTLCAREDVQWVQQFHQRILERSDPLARLKENGYRADSDAQQRLIESRIPEEVHPEFRKSSQERYVNGPAVVIGMLIAVVVTCAAFLFLISRL